MIKERVFMRTRGHTHTHSPALWAILNPFKWQQ